MRRRHSAAAWPVVWLGLLQAACGPSVEEVIENHRPAVEKKLAALRAIESRLDGPGEPAGAPGEPLVFSPEEPGFNACALQRQDFKNLASYNHPDLAALGPTGSVWVPAVARVVRGPLERDNATLAEQHLVRFQQIRYALVLLQHEWQPGALAGYAPLDPNRPAAGLGDRLFRPGRFRGEALLFELASARLLLRLPVEAEHDPEFVFFEGTDPERAIRDHLADRIRIAIGEALAKAVPGSKGP